MDTSISYYNHSDEDHQLLLRSALHHQYHSDHHHHNDDHHSPLPADQPMPLASDSQVFHLDLIVMMRMMTIMLMRMMMMMIRIMMMMMIMIMVPILYQKSILTLVLMEEATMDVTKRNTSACDHMALSDQTYIYHINLPKMQIQFVCHQDGHHHNHHHRQD